MKIQFKIGQHLNHRGKPLFSAEFGGKMANFTKLVKLFSELFMTMWEQCQMELGDTLTITVEKNKGEENAEKESN